MLELPALWPDLLKHADGVKKIPSFSAHKVLVQAALNSVIKQP